MADAIYGGATIEATQTAAPLIPVFQDYVLASLQKRGNLRQLEVISQKEQIDAWTLDLEPDDKNVMMPGSKQAFYV